MYDQQNHDRAVYDQQNHDCAARDHEEMYDQQRQFDARFAQPRAPPPPNFAQQLDPRQQYSQPGHYSHSQELHYSQQPWHRYEQEVRSVQYGSGLQYRRGSAGQRQYGQYQSGGAGAERVRAVRAVPVRTGAGRSPAPGRPARYAVRTVQYAVRTARYAYRTVRYAYRKIRFFFPLRTESIAELTAGAAAAAAAVAVRTAAAARPGPVRPLAVRTAGAHHQIHVGYRLLPTAATFLSRVCQHRHGTAASIDWCPAWHLVDLPGQPIRGAHLTCSV
ncbi:hypothetical protein T492DRAFT_107135 [Pavlovales sp. CCMP2436]|nr:hypothetical protein T492DRAFT_107135 [Pavlovales sp. CCMP2436]